MEEEANCIMREPIPRDKLIYVCQIKSCKGIVNLKKGKVSLEYMTTLMNNKIPFTFQPFAVNSDNLKEKISKF